jgi:poly(glycerol-phosphate) alpha-glucosyltransferase
MGSLSIALVTRSTSRLAGGMFNSVRKSALSLRELGHHVRVFALEDEYAAEDKCEWEPLIPVTLIRRGPAALGYSPAIEDALRQERFDVVHQHGIWDAFSLQVSNWRRRSGGSVMISPRGMLDPWALKHSRRKKQLASLLYERRNLNGARCLHALNASEAAAMRAFGLTNPIAVIPNGTDVPGHADPPRPSWWPDGKVLLFVGRIHPKKGVVELVDSFARLRAVAPDIAGEWSVVIAGWDDGGCERALHAAVVRHGLQDRVVLPGPIYGPKKDFALRHASAFILPSYSEGLPMSVLEAWAYGVPVLMTEACNIPEGFAAGAASRIEPFPDALAASLELLLAPASFSNLVEMGRRGRALVQAQFAWAEICRRHVEVYRWMIARHTATPSCIQVCEPSTGPGFLGV